MTDETSSSAMDGDGDGKDEGSAPTNGATVPTTPDAGSAPNPAAGETLQANAPPAGQASRAVAPAGAPPTRPSFWFLAIVSILSLGADLGTKWWAKNTLDDPKLFGGKKISVIGEHVSFIFARNRGGAWGLLQDESEAVRRPFFLLISLAAIVFIVTLYRRVTPRQIALKWGLPLVLGGALGNLIDRIRYGFVVDFIDVRVTSTFRWPTFNIADIAIVVGVGLMAIDMFTSRKPDAIVSPSSSSSPLSPEPAAPGAPPAAEPKGEP